MAAKLPRIFLDRFGADGPTDDYGQFGSKTDGTPIKTKSIALIQALNAWKIGWKDAIDAGTKAPFLEDMNSLFLVLAYMQCYVFQDGIPEWDTDTEYFIGSIVRKPDTFELYGSLQNNNAGNALPDQEDSAQWQFLPDGDTTIPPGTRMLFYQASAPIGWTAVAVNDKFLRVVSAGGTGGTTGGTGLTPASTITLAHTHTVASHTHTGPSHTHTTPSHTHDLAHSNVQDNAPPVENIGSLAASGSFLGSITPGPGTTYWQTKNRTETSGSGTTGASGTADTGATAPGTDSQLTTTAFQYADVIVASKD